MNRPTNDDDVIDSRDVIERIAELEATAENDDGRAELFALTALRDEASDYGETLVRDSYFEDYARELAEDCGMINANATWPNNCIDWEQAARELQMDYTEVDFDGVIYWIR